MNVFSPEVFVLARSKKCTSCWSAFITKALNRAGIQAYRVTPGHTPRYAPEDCKLLINYGTGMLPNWFSRLPDDCVIFNHPDQVAVSANKLKMMQAFDDVYAGHNLTYYTTREQAQAAVDRGDTIVSRTLLSSHSGRGIVLSPPSPLPDARLYTVLKRRQGLREYRLFMYDGKFMDIVQKKRKTRQRLLEFLTPEAADVWWNKRERQVIRCWDNGWSFCHNNLNVDDPDLFDEIAQVTSRLIKWGCLDLLIDSRTKEWYAIEINTAPGLDAGNTQHAFVEAFVTTAEDLGIPKHEYNSANFKEY